MGKKSITTCKDCVHYWRHGLLDICIYDGIESACGDMRICSNFEKREVFKAEELTENTPTESLCTNCANKSCTIGTGGKVRVCMMFKDTKGEEMLEKRSCMNFDEEADRCAFGYNCTLNCPDFEKENRNCEREENMEYKRIEITFKSGETITYNEGEWDDYAYDGNAVIIKKNSAWVGIYNFDSVFCVELKA